MNVNTLLLGDCLEILKTLPSNSVDSLITDPPAGISFFNKTWDGNRSGMLEWVNWLSEVLSESLRVMKPGACGVIWSIPRTCGWTQLAIEMSGLRTVDSIAILQGQGFPKGLDLGKKAGESWEGWKSPQLKPSHETWFLVQKPVESTITKNVIKWGTGGINIESCRIKPTGRYPANTILICSPDCNAATHAEICPVTILAEQGGERKNGGSLKGKDYLDSPVRFTKGLQTRVNEGLPGDSGTAVRYFKQLSHDLDTFHYFTKAATRDRNCDGQVINTHPTVKNRELMRYFCRLLTPLNGIVLDPFGGSGSTAIGAIEEGFNYILIEKEEEYYEIATARIATVSKKVA